MPEMSSFSRKFLFTAGLTVGAAVSMTSSPSDSPPKAQQTNALSNSAGEAASLADCATPEAFEAQIADLRREVSAAQFTLDWANGHVRTTKGQP